MLSYSSINIPNSNLSIPRRDLFDAKFQLIDQDQNFVNDTSDLIPGLYEGGLKSWECSIDLVKNLSENEQCYNNNNIFEVSEINLFGILIANLFF